MDLKRFDTNKKTLKKYILKNGSIINPETKKLKRSDIYIKDNLIEKIGKNLESNIKEKVEIDIPSDYNPKSLATAPSFKLKFFKKPCAYSPFIPCLSITNK